MRLKSELDARHATVQYAARLDLFSFVSDDDDDDDDRRCAVK